MKFGHFTLSDNHYENNNCGANSFISDILDETVYAEAIGLHSAWIGEHHFSTLGRLSCPDLVPANVAARTTRIRMAPAVTVLPLHHPIRVAEHNGRRSTCSPAGVSISPPAAVMTGTSTCR